MFYYFNTYLKELIMVTALYKKRFHSKTIITVSKGKSINTCI